MMIFQWKKVLKKSKMLFLTLLLIAENRIMAPIRVMVAHSLGVKKSNMKFLISNFRTDLKAILCRYRLMGLIH